MMAKQVKKNLKVKILLPVAGVFRLSFNVGEVYTVNAQQAKELVDAKYAEYVK